jgi:23S rRNA pseudouridine2605 synthase
MRLNKLLSAAGVASRRVADELIAQGRITINGRIVTALGTKADPEADEIKVDGRRLKAAPERRYLLLNKPRGVVSTRSDPQRRPTVIDLWRRPASRGTSTRSAGWTTSRKASSS